MILILDPQISSDDERLDFLMKHLEKLPGVRAQLHQVTGSQQTLSEIYLIGDTHTLDRAEIAGLDGVDRVVRISQGSTAFSAAIVTTAVRWDSSTTAWNSASTPSTSSPACAR